MTLPPLFAAALLASALMGACTKIPESEEAKKVGAIPKQTLDKATANLNSANDQAAERLKEAEKQK